MLVRTSPLQTSVFISLFRFSFVSLWLGWLPRMVGIGFASCLSQHLNIWGVLPPSSQVLAVGVRRIPHKSFFLSAAIFPDYWLTTLASAHSSWGDIKQYNHSISAWFKHSPVLGESAGLRSQVGPCWRWGMFPNIHCSWECGSREFWGNCWVLTTPVLKGGHDTECSSLLLKIAGKSPMKAWA